MIYSRIERIATIGVALFMICAAILYLFAMSTVGMESAGYAHYQWSRIPIEDLILISVPAVLLIIYAVLLLMFYRVRGIQVSNKEYTGSKFPWM